MISRVPLIELALALMAMIPVGLGLGVSGVVFDADVSPGESISHEMTVSLREGEMPLDLVVVVEDWNQSIDGANQPQEEMAGHYIYSARSFLKAEPSKLHIDPGESKKIVVRGDIPLDVGAGGRYALIGIYSIPEKAGEETENSVGVSVAVNALVRLTISGTEISKQGAITSMGMDDNCQNLSLVFKNEGNYHFKAGARALLKDSAGNILAKSSSPLSSNILPEASRLFQLALVPEEELKQGSYFVNASVESEDGTLLASKEIEIKL
ncbi:MAG: hypothetical protein GYA29_03760 [Methanothrix sp.]|jgi:hypothetical protein|nr:hypothetical protein [Methanothrix sp.]